MFKKTITYTDYNGNERTEDFYFNLSKAELTEMEMSTSGGLTKTIERIISEKDTPSIIKIFKDLILKSYGVKSLDGRLFEKIDANGNPLSRQFEQTEAYSVLFTELATDDVKAAEFVNGIIPADAAKKIAESQTPNNIVGVIPGANRPANK